MAAIFGVVAGDDAGATDLAGMLAEQDFYGKVHAKMRVLSEAARVMRVLLPEAN